MSGTPRTLWLGQHHRSKHQLRLSYGLDELHFASSYWYADVDFLDLEKRHGRELLEKIYFYITAFEANKLCSLRPDVLDLGPYRRFHTAAFADLWRTVAHRVWGQWRYEHDDPHYAGPEILGDTVTCDVGPLAVTPGSVQTLSFCGGGKDSLVALRLLEGSGIAYDSFAYSSSIYGASEPQHGLIDGLLKHASARHHRRLWTYDDFLDSPVARLHPELGSRYLLAAETPSSVFAALPLALTHGYRNLVVGHEHSADFSNLTWERSGEEINHQWGKSLQAEILLAEQVRRELLCNVDYFSLLKPIYDSLIFALLADDLPAVASTHSCNIQKPWCRRCPKCAYVWLGYMAYLPVAEVSAMFGENLLDLPENQLAFRRMLGLEEHTPFECIGTVGESRLAFELCRRKGLKGKAMDVFEAEVPAVDVAASLERYLQIGSSHAIPPSIFAPVRRLMEAGVARARRELPC